MPLISPSVAVIFPWSQTDRRVSKIMPEKEQSDDMLADSHGILM
jgi:hypothetical protein